ncbi:MAG: nitroreductase [Flavobacteriaceae bacterium]
MNKPMKVMTFDEVVRNRRSVRGFLPKEVPMETMREIFELAQLAPSNCNIQPWITHVVSGESLKQLGNKLVEAAKAGREPDPDWPADKKFPGVYRERQIDAAVRLYGNMGVARHDVEGRQAAYLRNQMFFDAPHAVFIFMLGMFDAREAVDLGIYAQNLMLSMTSRGVDSCAQGALGLYASIVREHLGLEPDLQILFGISFGYEDPAVAANRTRTGRATVDEHIIFHR